MLAPVRTVIVDEIHAVAGQQAGVPPGGGPWSGWSTSAAQPVQRIGLSATQRPIETVARLLVGAGHLPLCAGRVTRGARSWTRAPPRAGPGHGAAGDELGAVASAEQMAEILELIAGHVLDHRTTLVFVNTRRMAERIAHQLGERLGEGQVAAHHGSLSKDRRAAGGVAAAQW